ncbi:MAG: nitroreductase [Pseudomonadota bacterium]
MPDPRPEVMEFLLSRRSRPAKTLGDAAPVREVMMRLLTAAARVPDHGKLEPWRFVVIEGDARSRTVEAARARGLAIGFDADRADKAANAFRMGGVIVAVVASPNPQASIPVWEQELSAGAVCLGLVNASLAEGWGANWLTGPFAREDGFLAEALGCQPGEFVAGFVHIGSETVRPADRPRPNVEALTHWL